MKKYILFLSTSFIALMGQSQSIMPKVFQYPLTGFNQLRNVNPLIIEQAKNTNNEWRHLYQYSWMPSVVAGIKKENSMHEFVNNIWELRQSQKDSLVMDAQNRIAVAFEEMTYVFNGNPSVFRLRYTFTYNSANKPSRVQVQRALTQSYANYTDLFITYDSNGNRIADSMIWYQRTAQVYKVYYTYDANGKVIRESYYSFAAGDTTNITAYGYHQNKITTVYSQSYNESSGVWQEERADTFGYDSAGQINRVISYAMISLDGQVFTFSPISHERYHYNTNSKLDQIIQQYWNSDQSTWEDSRSYAINYVNGEPSTSYIYLPDTNGGWNSEPSGRLLFSFPTALERLSDIADNLKLYPNPASDWLQLESKHTALLASVKIYNSNGQEEKVSAEPNPDGWLLNTSTLPTGIYFIHIHTEAGLIRKKFMVE